MQSLVESQLRRPHGGPGGHSRTQRNERPDPEVTRKWALTARGWGRGLLAGFRCFWWGPRCPEVSQCPFPTLAFMANSAFALVATLC